MGADERVDEVSHARPQVELLLHLHHVDLGDRPHPGRVAAGLGQRGRAGVSEIAVVAGRVATQQLLHVAVELCKVRLGLRIRVEQRPHPITLEVAVTGTEEAGELAGRFDHVSGERAHVVAREGIAIAVAEATPVARAHVGDSKGGPAHVCHIGSLGARASRGRVGRESADEREQREKKGNDGEAFAKDHHGPGPPSLRSVNVTLPRIRRDAAVAARTINNRTFGGASVYTEISRRQKIQKKLTVDTAAVGPFLFGVSFFQRDYHRDSSGRF